MFSNIDNIVKVSMTPKGDWFFKTFLLFSYPWTTTRKNWSHHFSKKCCGVVFNALVSLYCRHKIWRYVIRILLETWKLNSLKWDPKHFLMTLQPVAFSFRAYEKGWVKMFPSAWVLNPWLLGQCSKLIPKNVTISLPSLFVSLNDWKVLI